MNESLNQQLADSDMQEAYWFTHRKLQSRAKVFYGNVYNLPPFLGEFDVALFGMILTHLRDPFQALYSASRLVRRNLIVVNQLPGTGTKPWQRLGKRRPAAYFLPSRQNTELMAWWSLSEECIRGMLGALGFEVVRTVKSRPQCLVPGREGREECTAFVAERIS